jgi:hypothetical protein
MLFRMRHASTRIIGVGVAMAFLDGIVAPTVLAVVAFFIDIQVMLTAAAYPYTLLVRRGVARGEVFGHVDAGKRNRLHDEERK